MPFDALTMAAVADELQSAVAGGRIQRIIQPSAASVGLAVYGRGGERWLLLSADPQLARVHLVSGKLAKAFASPSPFIMLLRKHLEGRRLTHVEHAQGERVMALVARGGGRETRLTAEAMGRHSNIVLVGEDSRVLGAIKIVTPLQSRVRPISPGAAYHPPPRQERDSALFPPGPRLDPQMDPVSVQKELARVPSETPLKAALLGLFLGCSPFLAEQISLRAGYDASQPIDSVDLGPVVQAAQSLYSLYHTHAWQPCAFLNRRGQANFAPYPALGVSNLQEVGSMSAAIEQTVGSRESRDALDASRSALIAEIDRARRATARRIASLREGLEAAGDADTIMQRGRLLLAYQHAAEPGSAELAIPDLGITIPLDPRLTPAENAERLFRRYRKLREAQRKLPAMIRAAESEAARLDDLARFAQIATSEGELAELRRDLRGERQQPTGKQAKGGKSRGPMRVSLDGYTLLVGRNARENDEVTFRLAGRNAIWLHVRERTGSHVVIQNDGSSIPERVLERAAQIAAYFSEARTDSSADVDVARVRDVRKVPGGPPGRVTYRNFRTVRVTPEKP